MADNIKKLKYEPGDKIDTSDRPMTCPSGHPITRARGGHGGAHMRCTVCDWTDRSPVMGAKPVEVVSKHEPMTDPRNPKRGGVTVISGAGIEKRGQRPNIVSR